MKHEITEAHSEHLTGIQTKFNSLLQTKYTKGVIEHGGNLWQKKNLIDMAIDEAVDQVVYLLTLKQQIEDSGVQLGEVSDEN